MNSIKKDVIIIGGGPAGMAAAVRLREQGVQDILILEREKQLGGILRQCIHDGFGLTRFGESLSGPEYAARFAERVVELGIEVLTDTTVLDISSEKVVIAVSKVHGYIQYKAKAVVLSMGCRERTRGAISLPGSRPSGVLTAGMAQSYINLQNKMVGKEIVILGSGDIGMIMARRLTLEGAHVQAVLEVLRVASGLPRNIAQCLDDYDIPLYLSHTVIDIKGKNRLTGITAAKVDENRKPIAGTEIYFDCDTLILSVGLIPENELSLAAGVVLDNNTKGAVVDENYQTVVQGVFSAGNVLHVHDLVDFVSLEAESLAECVAKYLEHDEFERCDIMLKPGDGVGYVLPQKISGKKDFILSMRVRGVQKPCTVVLTQGGQTVFTRKIAKAIPAEMIQIPIAASALLNSADLEVSVR